MMIFLFNGIYLTILPTNPDHQLQDNKTIFDVFEEQPVALGANHDQSPPNPPEN